MNPNTRKFLFVRLQCWSYLSPQHFIYSGTDRRFLRSVPLIDTTEVIALMNFEGSIEVNSFSIFQHCSLFTGNEK